MPYSLILDLFVAVLLAVTIGFAIVLNKRLGRLRKDRAALEKLAVSFGESTDRAEEGLEKLVQTTDVLQARLDQSQALKDDLAFLIERGDRAADTLENLIRVTRDITSASPAPPPEAPPVKPLEVSKPLSATPDEIFSGDGDEGKSEAERELLKAIRSAG